MNNRAMESAEEYQIARWFYSVHSAIKPFSKQYILDSSKLKDFADDNSEFDENGGKFSERIENTVGK